MNQKQTMKKDQFIPAFIDVLEFAKIFVAECVMVQLGFKFKCTTNSRLPTMQKTRVFCMMSKGLEEADFCACLKCI